ncbi:hypothetical protein [Amycolatopsis taiwanensis]|nr:hypothetical protein [Amycolatopsis taiwanensis]
MTTERALLSRYRGAFVADVTRFPVERPVDTIAVARKLAEEQRDRAE